MAQPEPTIISSAANPTVKRLVRLRDNRKRRRQRSVIVDGWHEIARAIDGGLELLGLYLVDSDLENQSTCDRQVAIGQATQNQSLQFVTTSIMAKISYGQSPRGVVAEFAVTS